MTEREPTTPRWTPQSTTPLEEPPSRVTARFARGSVAPPVSEVDDADSTAPRVRLVALFEPEPAVRVSLDRRPPRASTNREPVTAPWPRRDRGAPWIWPAIVIAVIVLLGVLMLTR